MYFKYVKEKIINILMRDRDCDQNSNNKNLIMCGGKV